jgi:iron complex transport system substrate-binding protein
MRILSLLPAATDIVTALGAGDELIGITHECAAPRNGGGCPRVTATAIGDDTPAVVDAAVRSRSAEGASLYTLDTETILRLHPEVVLTQAVCDVCAVDERDVRSLAARMSPQPLIISLAATTLEGVLADIERVAIAIGRSDAGTALVVALRARLRGVHDRLRSAAAPRPRVAVIEWPDPLFVAGHWVPEMIRRAGGQDVLAEAGAHSEVTTVDRIAAADPAILIIAPCGYTVDRAALVADDLLSRPEWQWAHARGVCALDANTLTSRPGPALVRGVEVLAAVLHPTLFPAPPADAAIVQRPAIMTSSHA